MQKPLCRQGGYACMEHTSCCVPYTRTVRTHTRCRRTTLCTEFTYPLYCDVYKAHTSGRTRKHALWQAWPSVYPAPTDTLACVQGPAQPLRHAPVHMSPRAPDSACDAQTRRCKCAAKHAPSGLSGRPRASQAGRAQRRPRRQRVSVMPPGRSGPVPRSLPGPAGSPGRPSLHPLTVGAAPGGCELTAGRNTGCPGNTATQETVSMALGRRRPGLWARRPHLPRGLGRSHRQGACRARHPVPSHCCAVPGAGVKSTSSGVVPCPLLAV